MLQATIAAARSELLALDAGIPDGPEGGALCPVRGSPQVCPIHVLYSTPCTLHPTSYTRYHSPSP